MPRRLSENHEAEKRYSLVVLAAGLSTRFCGEKLRAKLGKKQLLQHVLDAFGGECYHPKLLTVRQGFELDSFEMYDFEITINESPEKGISSSIRKAVEALGNRSGSGIIVLLGDMPFLKSSDAKRLIDALGNRKHTVVSFEYDGIKGFPTLLTSDLIPCLSELEGDTGIIDLVRKGIAEYVPVAGELRHIVDFDYREDLEETRGHGR